MSCTDYRSRVCEFEDDLFATFRSGHQIIKYTTAVDLIAEVFESYERRPPRLRLVPGFDDPKIGGLADISGNCILIERGYLYRYLVLHECAHLLAPHDRSHGAAFVSHMLALYTDHIGIPPHILGNYVERHGLPYGRATVATTRMRPAFSTL